MKVLKITLIIAFVLSVFYLIGPRPQFSKIDYSTPPIAVSLDSLDGYIAAQEAMIDQLKQDNEARIIWENDSLKQKTKYVLLYLHGFSASQKEGDPLHKDFARHFGMNLYLPRLYDHGRNDENTFINFTPDNYVESAQQALEIAKKLGDSIIVMSCSTGGTLAILLDETCPQIAGHIFYSPNIDLFDPSSDLIVQPWGKQLLHFIMKGDYNDVTYNEEAKKYWNPRYHINGVIALKSLLHDEMTDVHFKQFKKPFFLGYYYDNEELQDKVVSVEEMLRFYTKAGTPLALKEKIAFPKASAHVISSDLFSKDLDHIRLETYKFASEKLGIQPKI